MYYRKYSNVQAMVRIELILVVQTWKCGRNMQNVAVFRIGSTSYVSVVLSQPSPFAGFCFVVSCSQNTQEGRQLELVAW